MCIENRLFALFIDALQTYRSDKIPLKIWIEFSIQQFLFAIPSITKYMALSNMKSFSITGRSWAFILNMDLWWIDDYYLDQKRLQYCNCFYTFKK